MLDIQPIPTACRKVKITVAYETCEGKQDSFIFEQEGQTILLYWTMSRPVTTEYSSSVVAFGQPTAFKTTGVLTFKLEAEVHTVPVLL